MPRAAYEDVRLSATLKYRSQTVSKTFNSGPAERRALEYTARALEQELSARVTLLRGRTVGSLVRDQRRVIPKVKQM